MNIFILSEDPVQAAVEQCDKHVVKMIVESAQMLSTAHRLLDGEMYMAPSKSGKRMVKHYRLNHSHREQLMYKAVHAGHPCTIWTMETSENYTWHYKHFVALCDEYTYRYGKKHATDTRLRYILKYPPTNTNWTGGLTQFALAMKANPECIYEGDPVRSYRKYYHTKMDRFKMAWSKRNQPEWFHANVHS